jgi:hypothetical protein
MQLDVFRRIRPMEPNRPDLIDDLISGIVGLARPAVDAAIDKAALIALDTIRQAADELRDTPHATMASQGVHPDEAYSLGWDDGLTALILALDGVRRRLAPNE